MRLMILVVSVVVASWSSTARASGLLDMPIELKLSFPSAPASPDTALHLLDVRQPFAQMAQGQMEPGTRAIVALVLSFFVGFGTGHFVLGDSMAMTFLLLDVGMLLIAFVVPPILAAIFVAGGNLALIPVIGAVAALFGLAFLAVHIWEFVDCLFKSGIMAGPAKSVAIIPGGGLQVGAPRFSTMAANGLSFRF